MNHYLSQCFHPCRQVSSLGLEHTIYQIMQIKMISAVMRDGAIKYSLTSWAASDDKLADFIINKDEEWVGEGAEPPVWSGKEIGPKLKSHLF